MSAPDCILSVHLNPLTCGVARFNLQLAAKLGIPCVSVAGAGYYRHPLVSIKASECMGVQWGPAFLRPQQFDILWHDAGFPQFTALADQVWYATETGCPSTLQGNATRGTLNVLSFGMAHKYQAHHFERLKDLLDRTPGVSPNPFFADYTVSVSTGIHEGSPWEETFTANMQLMRGVFGDHLRALGFLADDALAKELREVQAVALFFDPAARANNTSLWAALEAGTPVITNLDQDSPPELQHGVSVFDLAQLTEWPDAAQCRVVRAGGRKAAEAYSWERLLAKLRSVTIAV